MFRKSVKQHHVNPRFRAYGKARIDIAMRATNQSEWEKLWKDNSQKMVSLPLFFRNEMESNVTLCLPQISETALLFI